MPFEIPGYLAGWESPFPAHLVSDGRAYEIHIAVKSKSTAPEEKTMVHEGILARMGRLLAAIASETIDNAENSNKVALVKQAIREIDAGADEARHALGKSRAEEFRLKRRREELDAEIAGLTDKIRLAVAESREDLARAASHGKLIWNRRAPRSNVRWISSNSKSTSRPRRYRRCLARGVKPKPVSPISKRASKSIRRRKPDARLARLKQ